jgi:hypothetical protein
MPFKTGLVYTLDCGEFGQNLTVDAGFGPS